jgi:hypothetical protein
MVWNLALTTKLSTLSIQLAQRSNCSQMELSEEFKDFPMETIER